MPTEKQKSFICAIEATLGVEFNGKTKGEASAFITRYADDYYMEISDNCFSPNFCND